MKYLIVTILASVATLCSTYPIQLHENDVYSQENDYEIYGNGCDEHGDFGGGGCGLQGLQELQGSLNVGGDGGGYYGSEAAAPSYVQGPAAGSKQVYGPVEGPQNIQGPSNGPLNLVGPQQGPASIVGPSQGTASIIGATNGGAHIVGSAQAPITYSEGVAVQSGGLGGYGNYGGQEEIYNGHINQHGGWHKY